MQYLCGVWLVWNHRHVRCSIATSECSASLSRWRQCHIEGRRRRSRVKCSLVKCLQEHNLHLSTWAVSDNILYTVDTAAMLKVHYVAAMYLTKILWQYGLVTWCLSKLKVQMQLQILSFDITWTYFITTHLGLLLIFLWPINIKWQNGWNSRTFCSCKSEEGIQQNLQND